MEVRLFGMVTEVKLLHPLNASLPIAVTLFGMVTEVKLLQIEYLQVVLYQQFAC